MTIFLKMIIIMYFFLLGTNKNINNLQTSFKTGKISKAAPHRNWVSMPYVLSSFGYLLKYKNYNEAYMVLNYYL